MEGFYVCVAVLISGFGCVMGATVNMTLSDPSPTEGNNPVTMTCVYHETENEEIKFVFIDSFKGQHYGYTNLVKYDVAQGTTEWQGDGLQLRNRAEIAQGNGTLSLTLNSVTCSDTKRYKCDLTLAQDKQNNTYNLDIEALNVQDSSGETCGKAHSNVSSVSSLVCFLIASILLR